MYVPPNVVDNHRLSLIMDTTDEWIRQRTGIVTRHYAEPDQATSDLAVEAASRALEDAGVEKAEIDYVVFATMTPDYYFPGSGTILQHKLGLETVPCLDIRQQCAGFLYGLQVSDAMIRAGQYRNVLLVGADTHCGFMPWSCWDLLFGRTHDRVGDEEYAWNTKFRDRAVLFGDGAGAFVLSGSPDERRGILDVAVHSDGAHVEKMWVPGGGSAYRPYFDPSMTASGATVPIVEGREVYRLATTFLPEAVHEICRKNGLGVEDVHLAVMHQANLRINEAVQKRLGLPDEKVYNNIQKYGNTTDATLPMAFHEARTARNLEPGNLVCFAALGSGLNWGAALYRI